ncbi:Histone-lysine N-methyltransferase ASHH1 [Apostasia shenzhenica]|uniref:Histone-lysine N-methyltransferase ASHH1 n=1 Tax=Apostasia shenzhenica TaxID=1088818 RepID=A0A2I0AP86_9ASPA|nr:Histone-lysine N-methyltransferase ASHH1 [Apostasia shenzhenica]
MLGFGHRSLAAQPPAGFLCRSSGNRAPPPPPSPNSRAPPLPAGSHLMGPLNAQLSSMSDRCSSGHLFTELFKGLPDVKCALLLMRNSCDSLNCGTLRRMAMPSFLMSLFHISVSYRHTKQKEEDIAICVCRFNPSDPDSACGEQCLNVLTSTECTPGHCPCGNQCKNQRFQKCQYAKTKLFKTDGCGWGLLADENIKAGQFIIEYCGEVISWREARDRSLAYEAQDLKDAYIISLNANESIDATCKGSLARFINHSCGPNCETRKWNVLGEVRVGIFAKHDILVGTELSYDYNFEWFGGTIVRCLCRAASCSGYLGAKSRGFQHSLQEATYVWEDDDSRYSVDNIPIYDSTDDEPESKFLKETVQSNVGTTAETETVESVRSTYDPDCLMFSQALPINVAPLSSVPMAIDYGNHEPQKHNSLHQHDAQQNFVQTTMLSRIRSNSVCRNYHIQSSPLSRISPHYSNGKSKIHVARQANVKLICERLSSKTACDELISIEELKNNSTSQLDSLYDEIRPAIEEHERDTQDSVSTSVAEKWIKAFCNKQKAEFDLYASIIKNISCTPRKVRAEVNNQVGEFEENGINYLENGP